MKGSSGKLRRWVSSRRALLRRWRKEGRITTRGYRLRLRALGIAE